MVGLVMFTAEDHVSVFMLNMQTYIALALLVSNFLFHRSY